MAPLMDSSPARAIAAQISAKARDASSPGSPSTSRHAAGPGSLVPPPTVPTMTLGRVTEPYNSPRGVTWNRVMPMEASETQAASWPQAMNMPASALA